MISERNQLGHWKAAALCLLIFLSLTPLTAQTPSARKLSEQDAKSIAALIIELDSEAVVRQLLEGFQDDPATFLVIL